MWTVRAGSIVMMVLLGLGGGLLCPDISGAGEATSPRDAMHQVMPGDDLHLIAGYYYGDARQWERIWRANRDQIKNPNVIERGALLRIPDVPTPAEAYADFVARAHPRAGAPWAPAKAEAPPVPEVEVRIMGEPAPGSAAGQGMAPGTAPGPAPTGQPEASGPPPVVGAPGTLPPRPIQPTPRKGPGPEGS
jgi:hypothetical protein